MKNIHNTVCKFRIYESITVTLSQGGLHMYNITYTVHTHHYNMCWACAFISCNLIIVLMTTHRTG